MLERVQRRYRESREQRGRVWGREKTGTGDVRRRSARRRSKGGEEKRRGANE